MPPKKRITRELILKKAFDMVHEEGIDSLISEGDVRRTGDLCFTTAVSVPYVNL